MASRRVGRRRPGTTRRLVSPMVGRERERRRLHDAFDQAVGDRSCQLFTVLGPAGVGKSRLVHEFVGELAGRALVARGRCLALWRGDHLLAGARGCEGSRRVRGRRLAEKHFARSSHSRWTARPSGELVARQVAELIGLAEHGGRAEDGLQRGARALRGRRADPAARARLRRHPLGRGNVPRAARAHRRRDAGRADLPRLPRSPGAARRSTGLGRRQAERHVGAARAALRRRVRAG